MFGYLQQVLGISTFLRPLSPLRTEVASPHMTPYVFLAEEPTAEEMELWGRILAAMKIDTADGVLLPCDENIGREIISRHPRWVIAFGLQAFGDKQLNAGECLDLGATRLLATHSLGDLLKNPALKKATWQHLQGIMLSQESES